MKSKSMKTLVILLVLAFAVSIAGARPGDAGAVVTLSLIHI